MTSVIPIRYAIPLPGTYTAILTNSQGIDMFTQQESVLTFCGVVWYLQGLISQIRSPHKKRFTNQSENDCNMSE